MLAPRMNAAYRAIVRAPWLVVAAIGAVTVVLGLGALRLRVDSSVTTLLPRGDPAKQRYDEVVARFGADEVDIIGVIADDVLAPATLEKIRVLTERAAAIPGVGSVISLTNVRDPIADVLNPPHLIPKIPETPAAREELRARIKDNPLFAGNLIAPDSRGAAVNVFLAADAANDEASVRRIDAALESLIAEVGAHGPEQLVLTGISHIKVNALALMRRDLAALTPASLAFVVLVLFFSFRTRRGVALPLLCVMTGVTWTMGIMGWVGEAISLAANQLVLHDPGRTRADTPAKPKGSVHGASVGVHAQDAANAWRNIARVSNSRISRSTAPCNRRGCRCSSPPSRP